MAMAYFRDDPDAPFDRVEITPAHAPTDAAADLRPIPLINAKLRSPDVGDVLPRLWLNGILEKCSKNSAATMIVGRAGTGKTAVAAEFAAGRTDASWYTFDAVDGDWHTFCGYLRAAVFRDRGDAGLAMPDRTTPFELFADLTAGLELRGRSWPSLLVLDGVHHLFDRPWFNELFDHLVASLPEHAHALLLSRSKPPTPVWRLRSKQVLNVIDEKLLAFSAAETLDLFARLGVPERSPEAALAASFGHAGALKEFALSRMAVAA